MEVKENFFTGSKDAVKEYLDDRLLLLKLQATDKISKAAAGLVTGILLGILGLLTLIFLGITGGYFFATLTNSLVAGFAIMTGIYILLIILVLAIKKSVIQKAIINGIISGMFGKEIAKDKPLTNAKHN